MRLTFTILALLLLFAFEYSGDSAYFNEEVMPGESILAFETGADTTTAGQLPIDASMFSEEYRLARLHIYDRPLGRFDKTGWNFILQDSAGADIAVVLDSLHSGINSVDTVWLIEFPLLHSEIDYDLSHAEYAKLYRPIAKREEKEHGIPAAITLAQGILESASGSSSLARQANNHFGIKCFAKRCKPGHCINKKDDSHKDFFRVFDSIDESFREHSKVLKKKRYKPLYQLSPKDYKGWAKGLQKYGYATSDKYAEKLIKLIERYELHQE